MRTVVVGVLCAVWTLMAQDTRTVTEPKIPASCTALGAQLTSWDGRDLAAEDEKHPDTARIQKALDGCAKGKAVELKASGGHNAFLTGPLQLREGVTLVVDEGVILFGSRDPRVYDRHPGSCGVVNEKGHGCKALIEGDHVAHAGVMGDGVIDGRGWAKLLGQNVSWWDLAQEAKVKNLNQSCPRMMTLTAADDFTLYRITLKNPGNFHVWFNGNGFTAWGVVIDTPKTARNTDGINPASATNVTITHCYIHAGDDNVAIKGGSTGPSSHITVAHNHFYTGHGMSIGSETDGGVNAIRVTDLSIDGADNGLRIKSNHSRGGQVHDVVYSDVCIRETKNPIFMDSNYSFYGTEKDKVPVFRDIQLHGVRVLTPGKITLDGYDEKHRLGMQFDNLYLDDPARFKISAVHAEFQMGPGAANLLPSGQDVMVSGRAGAGKLPSCEGKFVPMPKK